MSAPARALAGAARPVPRPQQPGPASPPLLTARNLTAGHPGVPPVLRDVSLEVFGGRCPAVLGASGTGKSTLARCLAGLHRQAAGTVRLDGAVLAPDVRSRTPEQRAAVQFVAQDPAGALHPRQQVRTALTRPMRLLRGVRDRRVLEGEITRLLRAVRLPAEYADRLPGELSEGERQRVVLACALAAGPRLLICDEVTAALDTVARTAMLDLLTELARNLGMAIVFITHDTAAARHLADEVMVLADGGIGGNERLRASHSDRKLSNELDEAGEEPMTLDEQLLAEAKRARDEVVSAQEQAELSQVRYQHSIRRLHAAGGSLREIANVLGMSYQRVHQIVDVAAGKGAVRWASLDSARCSFCGSAEEEVGRLVAGPGPFICGACVALATELITDGEGRADGPIRLVSVSTDRTRCSFCGRRRSRVTGMAEAVGRAPVGRGRRSNGSPAVCSDCIALSGELLSQSH